MIQCKKGKIMKIVFFDTCETTREYFKDKCFGGAEAVFITESAAECTDDIFDADIISGITHRSLTAETLSKFPNLKLIATRSQGVNHIDMEHCAARGIAVKNTAGYGSIAVAEFAVALLMNVARRIIPAARDMKSGPIDFNNYIGTDICGKTVGVIGTGAIGSHFAKLMAAFGAKVIAYDLFPNGDFDYVSMDEIYARADIIAPFIPATPENYHIIDPVRMKQGAIFINVARGELVCARKLYDALTSGKIFAAGLDVLEEEGDLYIGTAPITEYNKKLMMLDNVIVTPHIAFNSREANLRVMEMTWENIVG